MADTILVPFELPDPDPLSPILIEDLSSLDIVLLGYYPVPEQTPTEMAREQFEAEAAESLEELAEPFERAGASIKTRVVFGKNRTAALERIATEENCVAELLAARTEGIDRILVPIPDIAEFTRLPEFVNVLCEDRTQVITLFHVVEGDENCRQGERIVEETRDGLLEAGAFEPGTVETHIVSGRDHDEEILRTATEYDAVVMYEPEPNLSDRIFGTLPERIVDETGNPVIVVRRDY